MWGILLREGEGGSGTANGGALRERLLRGLQTCAAFEGEGPKVIVVMTLRDKLFMESYFRRMLPMSERHGMQLVIRQGNPLVPEDLMRVSAHAASATILVSDSAWCAPGPPSHRLHLRLPTIHTPHTRVCVCVCLSGLRRHGSRACKDGGKGL